MAGSPTSHVLQAFIFQFTTVIPAGDKLLNTTGHNGARPNSCRDCTGVFQGTHYYFPPVDPHTGRTLFNVRDLPMVSRTAASLAASAAAVAIARDSGARFASVHTLAKRLGVKGHSIFFAPTLPDRQRYPNFSYLWVVGPVAASYDPIHLILQNVVPLLWTIFSGAYGSIGVDGTEQYIMSPADVRAVGDEIAAACKTIPLSQARPLRHIATRCGSNKASDWMYFLLCNAEAVIAYLRHSTTCSCHSLGRADFFSGRLE